jgi:ribosomal protein S18 acetylase RimI-like enzyme
MHARDWRAEDDAAIATLYAAERSRWTVTLAWDTAATWGAVETGRRLGTVTGAVARTEAGEVAGWCFALLEGDTLQVGGFVSRSEEATSALIDVLQASPAGRAARRWAWFGWFDAPGLSQWLARHGASPVRFVYLVRPLLSRAKPLAGAGASSPRDWRATDLQLVPSLLASAYDNSPAGRIFAPSGSAAEWRHYAATLVHADGCGIFDSSLTVVERSGTGLDGVALMSRIAPSTAHLVQLAVQADAQSKGVGRSLLGCAVARAEAAGCAAMTLLVDERNTAARSLYEREGFRERAAFLSAAWNAGQPRTSSSEALPTGGVSTRR